ncbi:MAG: DUF2142 domain-containing protein [Bacilli bacterium]|nr:DUF2142 domain-containing protein [Bacilli bacterium]
MKNKIVNFIKNNGIFIVFCICFIILNLYYLNKTVTNANKETKIIISSVFIIIEIVFLILLKTKFKSAKIEKIFLLIAVPIGLLYLVIFPIGQIPDENTHYLRSYAISEGYIVSDVNDKGVGSAYLPDNVLNNFYGGEKNHSYSEVAKNIFEKSDNLEKKKYYFSNTSLYNFIIYVPQTTGILMGKILHLPPLMIAYLARLFNFATYILLLYFAIKLIPFLKKYVMLVALLPISLQEGVSLSPDALAISLSLLFVSLILYYRYEYKEKISNKKYTLLLTLSTILSLCKIVYIPILLLLLLIPQERFKSKKDKYIKVFLLIMICVIINGAWTIFATRYLNESNPGVNSSDQVKYILTSPFNYIGVMLKTTKEHYTEFLHQVFGKDLGALNISTYKLYPIISGSILLVLSFICSIKNKIKNNKERIIYLFIPITIILLIFTSLYVQWTPLKNDVIIGIQGRYFIPILIFVPLIFIGLFKKKNIKFDESKINPYIFGFIIFQLINAITMVLLYNI